MVRYIRDDERIARALLRTRRSLADIQRPTGTERERTALTANEAALTASEAALNSEYAKDLAEQLEGELGPLPGQLQTALGESAAALAEAGLARSDAQQAVADAVQAISDALAASIAAGNAQTTANGKNRVWYQGTAPTGTAHRVDDVWFNTSQGNRMARWNGTTWAVVEFGGAALANNAVSTAKLADDAVTSAKIALEAVGNDELAAVVKGAITTAQSTATAAQGTANTAQSNANQALADAAAAAGIAGGKADVLIQSTAPAAAMRKATTLWIDTTGGANTPKRWTTGTTWVAVTDKVATDAAANAATAQSIASGAASAAAAAQSAANAAQLAADAAQSTANGRAVVVRSTSAATAAGSYKLGDQWWQFSGANITGLWLHDGTAWVSQALTNAIIATLDAGKITTGFLAAARIQAATITGTHIAGATVTAANMVAGTITAASGIIANAAIGAAQIIDLAVSSAKIADLAVTNAKIANATIQNAKIANLDAAKITTGTLNAARIASNSIMTDKIAANAVTSVNIYANAVTAEKIAAGSVATDKLDALAVTAEKIAAGSIIAEKIAAGAITAGTIAAGAIDAMTIRGAQIYGGYIEAPVIASSDKLGSGANVLNDPSFEGTVNASWVLSGHAGDAAVSQVDTITWDKSWTSRELYPPADVARRNWGNAVATLRLTPAVRKTGSLIFANYAWLNTAARSFTNPYSFPNQTTWQIEPTGGTYDPSFTAVDSRAPLAGTAKTSYLTNTKSQAVVSGERWNVRLSFMKVSAERLAFIDLVAVEIINSSTSAVLWSRQLTADELAGGMLNDWWDSTFTGSVKYRIKTVYKAGGGTITRRPAVGNYARWSKDGVEQSVWSATAASWLPYNSAPRESASDSHSLFGTHGIDYIYRARSMELIATSAMFAKVEPEKGWRLTEGSGLELFNSLGAKTGQLDGEDNFISGTLSTSEDGLRWELVGDRINLYSATNVLLGSIRRDGTKIRVDGTLSLNGFTVPTEEALNNALVSMTSGFSLDGSTWLRKRSDGYVYGFIAIVRAGGTFPSGGTLAILPVGWRPPAVVEQSAWASQGGAASVNLGQVTNTGVIRSWEGSSGSQVGRVVLTMNVSYFAA